VGSQWYASISKKNLEFSVLVGTAIKVLKQAADQWLIINQGIPLVSFHIIGET